MYPGMAFIPIVNIPALQFIDISTQNMNDLESDLPDYLTFQCAVDEDDLVGVTAAVEEEREEEKETDQRH